MQIKCHFCKTTYGMWMLMKGDGQEIINHICSNDECYRINNVPWDKGLYDATLETFDMASEIQIRNAASNIDSATASTSNNTTNNASSNVVTNNTTTNDNNILTNKHVMDMFEMGFELNVVLPALERIKIDKEHRDINQTLQTLTITRLLNEVLYGGDDDEIPDDTEPYLPNEVATAAAAAPLPTPDDEKRIRCKICLDKEVDIMFEPCKHIVACKVCSKNQRLLRCPTCRTLIKKRSQIYFA